MLRNVSNIKKTGNPRNIKPILVVWVTNPNNIWSVVIIFNVKLFWLRFIKKFLFYGNMVTIFCAISLKFIRQYPLHSLKYIKQPTIQSSACWKINLLIDITNVTAFSEWIIVWSTDGIIIFLQLLKTNKNRVP